MRHVALAVPAYAGTVHLATMRSIMHDTLMLSGRGDRFSILDECGSAIIADVRAELVARFLAIEDATDLVFVDHDIVWERGALLRLVDHPVDVVVGIYPHRRDPVSFPVSWRDEAELWADPKTGLLEVKAAPAGFMRIRRHVLEAMVDRYKYLTFYAEHAPGERACGLFEPYRTGEIKLSEDYSFCRRWADIGGQIWVDPEIRMAHIGNKTFNGCLGEWLRSRNPAEDAA